MPATTPYEMGPSTTPPKKDSPATPFKEGSIMKVLNKKQAKTSIPPVRVGDNLYPSTPSWEWSSTQKISTVKPLDHYRPIKPLIGTKHEDIIHFDWEFPKYKYKFVFVEATQPPLTRAVHTGVVVVKVMGCAMGIVLALMFIASLMNKKNRTRRGVVHAVDAAAIEQHLQTDRRTPSESGEPGPLNNDSPPSYYECTLYSMKKGVDEMPPPYTNPEHHEQQQDGFVENERRACSENVAPEMRTELVFDSGRIIERLSLDTNSNNNKTRDTSNDNVG